MIFNCVLIASYYIIWSWSSKPFQRYLFRGPSFFSGGLGAEDLLFFSEESDFPLFFLRFGAKLASFL